MKDKKHLSVVDLETASMSANAVILSLGISTYRLDTFERVSELYINVDYTCPDSTARHWDNETIEWWSGQDSSVRNEAFKHKRLPSLRSALDKVAGYFKLLNESGSVFVFGNGSEFDISILQNAYDQLGIPIPWDFRNVNSVRTLLFISEFIFNINLKKSVEFKGEPHHALDDSKYEAEYSIETLKHMKNMVKLP